MITHSLKNQRFLTFLLLLLLAFGFSSCSVYTVDRSHLENKLKPAPSLATQKGLGLNKLIAMYKTQYNNRMDTLVCTDKVGKIKSRRVKFDSRVTIVTTNNRFINFYTKTLFIWNEEFLIGERSTFNLRKSKCFSVKLKDIARIEVRG